MSANIFLKEYPNKKLLEYSFKRDKNSLILNYFNSKQLSCQQLEPHKILSIYYNYILQHSSGKDPKCHYNSIVLITKKKTAINLSWGLHNNYYSTLLLSSITLFILSFILLATDSNTCISSSVMF